MRLRPATIAIYGRSQGCMIALGSGQEALACRQDSGEHSSSGSQSGCRKTMNTVGKLLRSPKLQRIRGHGQDHLSFRASIGARGA